MHNADFFGDGELFDELREALSMSADTQIYSPCHYLAGPELGWFIWWFGRWLGKLFALLRQCFL